MTAMVCELCRSNSFTKLDDSFYQCDYCRTKYTPAQAKTLLVEGTVRIDRQREAEKYLVLASSAFASGNHQEAYEYANRILEIDHQHPHAWFLKGASAGWSATLENFRMKLREMTQSFGMGAASLTGASRVAHIRQCNVTILQVSESIYQRSLSHARQFLGVAGTWDEHLARSEAVRDTARLTYSSAQDIRGLKLAVRIAAENVWGEVYESPDRLPIRLTVDEPLRVRLEQQVHEWAHLILRQEPGFRPPDLTQRRGGCFVVTATFGDRNAPPVRILQDFRDELLIRSRPGSAIIRWYNTYGPVAAKKIEHSLVLRVCTLVLLVLPAAVVALPALALVRRRRCPSRAGSTRSS